MAKSRYSDNFFLRVGTIKSLKQFRDALRHNKREIQAELGAHGHIDTDRIQLNYPLATRLATHDLQSRARASISSYQANVGRRIRKDAVLAIEVIYSLATDCSQLDLKQYFLDCQTWGDAAFHPAELISAEVHLDESHPHMHAIYWCVGDNQLFGSAVLGNKDKFRERKQHFYHSVGSRYGLSMPPAKLNTADTRTLGVAVIRRVESADDPIIHSPSYPLIKDLIQNDPRPFAQIYGIAISQKPKVMRTVVQIFTSKGKGSSWDEECELYPV
jgi:hypothetical protein